MERRTIRRVNQDYKGRILILEDMITREIWFRQIFIGWEYDFVCSAQDAIELLKINQYDYIFLDHDLVEAHYTSMEREDSTTGYQVALFLENSPTRSPNAKIVVHSCNISGSERMTKALEKRKAVHIPFPRLKEVLRVE